MIEDFDSLRQVVDHGVKIWIKINGLVIRTATQSIKLTHESALLLEKDLQFAAMTTDKRVRLNGRVVLLSNCQIRNLLHLLSQARAAAFDTVFRLYLGFCEEITGAERQVYDLYLQTASESFCVDLTSQIGKALLHWCHTGRFSDHLTPRICAIGDWLFFVPNRRTFCIHHNDADILLNALSPPVDGAAFKFMNLALLASYNGRYICESLDLNHLVFLWHQLVNENDRGSRRVPTPCISTTNTLHMSDILLGRCSIKLTRKLKRELLGVLSEAVEYVAEDVPEQLITNDYRTFWANVLEFLKQDGPLVVRLNDEQEYLLTQPQKIRLSRILTWWLANSPDWKREGF